MKTLIVYLICLAFLLLLIADWFFDVLIPVPLHPLYELGLGLEFGVISFVYADILTQPGHLLGFWREWLETKFLLFHVKQAGRFSNKEIERLKHFSDEELIYTKPQEYNMADEMAKHRWYLKPILNCAYCIGGEIALWVYPFKVNGYTLTGHLAAICVSILVSGLSSEFYNKWKATKK